MQTKDSFDQSCKRASFWSQSPIFWKPDLGPKVKFTEWVKTCSIAGFWWRRKVNMTQLFAINHFLLKI